MQPKLLREAEDWLRRATVDLQLAELALKHAPPLGAGVAFHAQQAAEKALKGFLTAEGRVFAKTHQLTTLLKDCEAIDPAFQQFTHAAQVLTPYAIEFRYPGGRLEPTEAEAGTAFQFATDIVQFVRQRLAAGQGPPQTSP